MTGAHRGGFTLVEIIVALLFLTVVAISFGATTQYSSRIMGRARDQLLAQEFMEAEAERLRIVAYDSLTSGSRAQGRGIASWTVVDSVTFRQVVLEVRYGSPAMGMTVDSLVLFRLP